MINSSLGHGLEPKRRAGDRASYGKLLVLLKGTKIFHKLDFNQLIDIIALLHRLISTSTRLCWRKATGGISVGCLRPNKIN
jgi:hypothetical protein